MRTLAAALLLAGMIGMAGCHGDADEAYRDPIPTPPPPVHQDLYNSAALNNFPMEVRTAFMRDFPNTGVSSASLQTSETGPALYKIVYIRNGQPHEVLYDRLGTVVSAPAQPANPNLGRPGFPAGNVAPPPANNQMNNSGAGTGAGAGMGAGSTPGTGTNAGSGANTGAAGSAAPAR